MRIVKCQDTAFYRPWQHSGFSVDKSVKLDAGDTAGLERVAAYMVRCPFSLDRMVSLSDDGKVVYRAEKAECQPFPMLGNGSRNFAVFDPLDFLAEITQHIPDPGMQMVRYYGWYSNKMRGQRTKRADSAKPDVAMYIGDEDTPYRKLCRMRWAALIKRVYEIDPLLCPKCGGTMKIVPFIEKRDQADVIERILKHCGLGSPGVPSASAESAVSLDVPPGQAYLFPVVRKNKAFIIL